MSHYSSSNQASPLPSPSASMPGTPSVGHSTDGHADGTPDFSALSLSLSRDQGTLHHLGHGSGSEAHTLSHVAETRHRYLAPRILSASSASGALSPENLPQAPTDLPQPSEAELQALAAGNPGKFLRPPEKLKPSSTNVTPGDSRTGTPDIYSSPSSGGAVTPENAEHDKTVSPTKASGAMLPPPAPSAGASAVGNEASRPGITQKKSVFGKLFDRNNSTASLVGNQPQPHHDTATGKGDSAAHDGSALVRRTSKKEGQKEEKERREREKAAEKERKAAEKAERRPSVGKSDKASFLAAAGIEGRPRAPSAAASNGYTSASEREGIKSKAEKGEHPATKEKEGGMGQALNDFMRNKVQRKSSVNGRRSEDGRSDRGSDHGDRTGSQYGGSTKGDNKSQSGQTTASLLKKYGVCEKVAIGKGATATVKLAHKWDRTTERLYAVKEFRKRRKNETEKEYVKKLTSEFCISSTLHHQNIVETVDLVQDEQQHWCEVMEYCPGGDLYAAIKKGNMSAPEINSYFKQILAGVGYLHSMGVAHRDIKPENLLLDARGHVKITDFGVSDVFRMCWEKTTHLSKGLCGSEPYIAPEQFEHKEYDARLVDVWATAVVFYCMHFQELPWRVAKPSDPSFGPYLQLYAGSSSPAPLSNLVPRECRNIIKRMLDPDPKTRATTDDVQADPWFAAIKIIPPIEPQSVTSPAL